MLRRGIRRVSQKNLPVPGITQRNHVHHSKIKNQKSHITRICVAVVFWVAVQASPVTAQALSGVTGLFHTPTAEMMPDKSVRFSHHVIPGAYSNYITPAHGRIAYTSNAVVVTFLPRVELMFRYSYELGFPRGPDERLFMDRMVAARVLVLRESRYLPALAAGIHDPGRGGFAANNYFSAAYFAASKTFSTEPFTVSLHTGYAFGTDSQPAIDLDGIFGGLSLQHRSIPALQWIVEYDSFQWNTALKLHLFGRVELLGGLYNFDRAAYGVSYRHPF